MPPINKESFKDCLRRNYSGVSAKVFKDHCVKSAKYGVFSGPYFPAFGLNTERYGVSPHIQSESGKIKTRITPNMDTFHAVTGLYINEDFSKETLKIRKQNWGNRQICHKIQKLLKNH